MEKSQPPAATVRPSATPPLSRQPAPARRTRRRRMLVAASVAALVVGALVLARYPLPPADIAPEDEQVKRSDQPAAEIPVASAGFAAPVVTERPAAPAVKTRAANPAKVTPARTRVAASATSAATSTAPTAATAVHKIPATGDIAATNLRSASVSIESAGPAPVTLTGCLEISTGGDEFRLTDTDGVDAPKSRSWRTGFLKKRPAPVALVEPADPHGLEIQVGKRVAATGQLTDRALKVSSVRVVGASCD